MHIVFVASEGVPFSKTGGLADLIGALPVELVKLGHLITVYLPLNKSARAMLPEQLNFVARSITIPFDTYNRFAGIVNGGVREGVQFYFVDCPEMFDREGLYGPKGAGDYLDNAERFGLFCRAVLEATKLLGVPEIYHLHDWEAALVSVLLRTVYYFDPLLQKTATVLTIHNGGYQGQFGPKTMPLLLLPWDLYAFEKLEQNDSMNFLKGGLVYSDYLTTVSPTYSKELQTAEFGAGLEGMYRKRRDDFRGILNGVNYSEWDPAKDPKLAAHYSSEDLSGKVECRRDLLHAFGVQNVPGTTAVVGVVSRLVKQKGFDLLAQIGDQLLERKVVLVALGVGEPYYESMLREFGARYPDRVAVQIREDDALAHKVEAGADIFLMPSLYEPCGLMEMYSMKYGTVPVVRATGGLEDTVDEWDAASRTGSGFKFGGYEPGDFLGAIDHALTLFEDKEAWKTVMLNGMAKDFGWAQPAQQYAEVYAEVLRRRG